jgi:hypothetical protein
MAQIILSNGTAQSTPAAGTVTVYSKTADKLLYYKDEAGVEHNITQGSSSQTFSGAPATAAAHFVRSDQLSVDNTKFPIYSEGTWAPNQGVGLTVVGAFSSSGAWVKIGKLVTVTGVLIGSTSIACTAGATNICTNLPFTASGIGVGSMINSSWSQIGMCGVSSATILYSATAMTASGSITFTITYQTT